MAVKGTAKPVATARAEAWAMFDEIIRKSPFVSPWTTGVDGVPEYKPDFGVLERLLGAPLFLSRRFPSKDIVRSGVPALALDVWLSFELRRAGFDADAVWPRPVRPRILPMPIARLLRSNTLSASLKREVRDRLKPHDNAKIFGKNYLKQVDVVISDWNTGPELLISTKRMDSSYGKNAANRVEESYGDAKNLRLRHPLAALGFVFCVRSDILAKKRNKWSWIVDQLTKLGREDDAYHATCLIMVDYEGSALDAATTKPESADRGFDASSDTAESGHGALDDESDEADEADEAEEEALLPADFKVADAIRDMPSVHVQLQPVPEALRPDRFLRRMILHVLDTTPIDLHEKARAQYQEAFATRPQT